MRELLKGDKGKLRLGWTVEISSGKTEKSRAIYTVCGSVFQLMTLGSFKEGGLHLLVLVHLSW